MRAPISLSPPPDELELVVDVLAAAHITPTHATATAHAIAAPTPNVATDATTATAATAARASFPQLNPFFSCFFSSFFSCFSSGFWATFGSSSNGRYVSLCNI